MSLYKNIPETPGVYIMKGANGGILYIGKAVNLKRRVSSYFTRPHDTRIEGLVKEIKKIDFEETGTAIEALILESNLIKKYQPPFNIKEKDDKSFLYVAITKEKYPRIFLVRGKDIQEDKKLFGAEYGPFTSASSIRESLRIIRKIFPYATHPEPSKPQTRACFDYQIGLCPGTCIGAISKKDYSKNIKNIKLFFSGKKGRIIKSLESEMKRASKTLNFERAGELKRQLFALQHIQDVALIKEDEISNTKYQIQNTKYRIEGYDISNISGTSAVGSMVVFTNNEPDKSEYRKFKIKTVFKPDDFGMLKEVLERRLGNNWPLPDLFLIDGGRGQVSAIRGILDMAGIKIPVVGIAKGPERKRNDVTGEIPSFTNLKTLIKIRDEAHRFAISYHKKIRRQTFLN
ncbi:excinuclease ABC subunit UvrC [Patescibacteria group bacterium]|nr:excinuclease ABC subunit UvrC [Patescibacteria group bacterium]